jgi:hypothetical protein
MDTKRGAISERILELFKTREEIKFSDFPELLPDLGEDSIKSALKRLRGGDGAVKRLRVKRYVSQSGAGRAQVVLELGDGEDAVRSDETISDEDVAEIRRRAAHVRAQQEELRYKREMKALEL